MAIAASYLYSFAKKIMLGQGSIQTESVASLSLTASGSVYAMLVLEAYAASTHQTDSTTGSWRAVFSSRANATNSAGVQTATADMLLVGSAIVSTSSNGAVAFDANDGVFTSCSTGKSVGGICIYKRVGADQATSLPIALIDIGSPITANGASINVNWDNGVNRIFAIS